MPPAGPPPLPPTPPPPEPADPRRHRQTGDHDPAQYERCWDELPAEGFDRRELRCFACTLRTAGTHLRQMFGGGEAPVEHLAVFPTAVVVLAAPPGRDVVVRRHPLKSLTWAFARAADTGGFSGLVASLSDSRRGELADAVALTLKSEAGEQTLVLRAGAAADALRELLPRLALDRARGLAAKGRNVRAEDYLNRVPAGTRAYAAAERLRAEIGTVATATVDHRQGLPGVEAGARGRLRFDARGLEFFDEAEGRSVRLPLTHVKRVLELRKGLYPDEYTKRVQTQRKKVLASRFAVVDPLLYLGARLAVASAQQDLADARFGQPLRNRLVVLAAIQGKAVPLIFDVAGADRITVERAAGDFHVHLETVFPVRGPAAPAAVGYGWEPAGIRDRLTALRGAGHLTGEDYGFLMTILSAGGRAAAKAGPPPAKAAEPKPREIKIELKLPDPPKAKPAGPPPVPKPAAKATPAELPESAPHDPHLPAEPARETEPVSADIADSNDEFGGPTAFDESDHTDALGEPATFDEGDSPDIELGLDDDGWDAGGADDPGDPGGLDAAYDPGLDAGFGDAEFGTDVPTGE